MIKSLAQRILRFPAVEEGASTETIESDPSALKGWMKDLPPIGQQPDPPPPATPPKTEKEPDGKTTDGSGRATGTGLPADKKPDDAAATTAAASSKVPDADSKPAAGADDGKAQEEDAKAIIDQLEKEKFPRHGTQWDDYKKKYGERLQNVETRLKGEIQARDEKLQAAEARIKTFEEVAAKNGEVDPATKATIEKLTKENTEMSNRLQVLDVTQHPKFQAYFENAINGQKELAKQILGPEKATEFEKLIALPDGDYKNSQLNDFVTDLPFLQQSRVGAVLNSLDAIAREKASEIAKAGQLKGQIDAQNKTKAETNAKQRERVTAEVLSTLQAEKGGMAAFQKRNGDAAWNDAVDKRIGLAKQFLSGEGLKPADLVRAAFHAAALPAILQGYEADMKESDTKIAQLESQLKALTAAQPKAGGSGASTGAGEGAVQPAAKVGQNPSDATNAFVKGLWAAGD